MRNAVSLMLASLALGACATPPATTPGLTAPAPFALRRVDFELVPGWAQADLAPALAAFNRACAGRRLRDPTANLPGGGAYGGRVNDWAPACEAGATVPAGAEHAFFEQYFVPHVVTGPGEARLTGYFEPVIEARRTPDAYFSAPLLRKPADLVTVDIAAFAEAYDNDALRGAPRRLTGQIGNGEVRPYPRRGEIAPVDGQIFAYANPIDLYNLQIQGSGRLVFPDGTQVRAAFAAQNGYRWRSALGVLRDSGEIEGAVTWDSFRAWSVARGPLATQQALNADPSYVFFSEEPIADASVGPRGAGGVPLTPMGSIAVDPAFHPYGALVFVDGTYDGAPFQRLLVAQDTGGAIRRGPLRGDVFFGAGPEAERAAERMNAPARWWTLLPRSGPMS